MGPRQAASLSVDEQALAGGEVRYDASYIRNESAPSWALLAKEYDTRPQGALAQWHLAELALREGKVSDAVARLRDCDQKLGKLLARRHRERTPSPADLNPFAGSALVPRQVYYQIAQAQAQQLLWVIDQVHAERDSTSALALMRWRELDPSQPGYAAHLNDLVKLCDKARTGVADVLRLALAQMDADADHRLTVLASLALQPKSPAYVQADFELGQQVLRLTQPRPGMKTAKEYFQAVADAGENPWKEQALQRLSSLAAPKEQP